MDRESKPDYRFWLPGDTSSPEMARSGLQKEETPNRIACVHGDVITHDTTIVDIEVLRKVVTTQVAVNPKLACDGLIGVDILASGEHKCSYLAQTRSKTKHRRQKKIRSYITPPNESSESQDSSAAPQSDTDNAKWDSSSMASSNEEESATDGEQSNNPEFQPADYELSISQSTDMSDLPNWSDDFFTAARVKRNLTRAQKRQERQLHAAKWGASIPLDGECCRWRKLKQKTRHCETSGENVMSMKDHTSSRRGWFIEAQECLIDK